MSKPVRQSICGVCGEVVGLGKGTVLEFGAGGRVHTQECFAVAQKPTLSRELPADDRQPLPIQRG